LPPPVVDYHEGAMMSCNLPWWTVRSGVGLRNSQQTEMNRGDQVAISAGCPSSRHQWLILVPVGSEPRFAGWTYVTLTTNYGCSLISQVKYKNISHCQHYRPGSLSIFTAIFQVNLG